MNLKEIIKKSPRFYAFLLFAYPFFTALIGLVKKKKGSKEHFLSTKSLLFKEITIAGKPINITIEPTNICNLDCPVCETGAGILERKNAYMSLLSFKDIIDKIYQHTNTLMFYYMGEPFMNKDAYNMISYAKIKGIPWVTTCTNGDPVHPEKLVLSGIDEVSFQIGGISQETHQIYRVNSNLERVLDNIRETIQFKKETNSNIKIHCGFILMSHNEHEIGEFFRVMNEIGLVEASIIDPCVRNIAQGKQFLPKDKNRWIYDIDAFDIGILKPNKSLNNKCPWIYYSMVILVNGDIVPCCRDPQGLHIMGNLISQEMDEIWNGDLFKNFRGRINADQGNVDICRLCSSYPASVVK